MATRKRTLTRDLEEGVLDNHQGLLALCDDDDEVVAALLDGATPAAARKALRETDTHYIIGWFAGVSEAIGMSTAELLAAARVGASTRKHLDASPRPRPRASLDDRIVEHARRLLAACRGRHDLLRILLDDSEEDPVVAIARSLEVNRDLGWVRAVADVAETHEIELFEKRGLLAPAATRRR